MSASTKHRLRKHADYQRVYKSGRKKWGGQFAYFSALREPGSTADIRSETSGARVGLTVPKALGKAVDRNRIKRRLRELVRKLLPLTAEIPADIVLHPKRSVLTADFTTLEREVAQIFQAVGGKASPGQKRAESARVIPGSTSSPKDDR